MASLPDPRPHADPATLTEMERMAAVRSHADGSAELATLYVAMFNNPEVARAVGALGEQLRFAGTLPDDLRELAILRFAARGGFEYEWAHHVRPGTLSGLSEETIAALAASAVPSGLGSTAAAVVAAVDHVADRQQIPAPVQQVLIDAVGLAGVVELVALCGLYALLGCMTTAFAIVPEPGLPHLPPRSEDAP